MSTSTDVDIAKSSSTLSLPCVVCDRSVLVKSELLTEESAALCEHCFNTVDLGVVKQLLTLRRQVRDLYDITQRMRVIEQALRDDLNELYDESKKQNTYSGRWQ